MNNNKLHRILISKQIQYFQNIHTFNIAYYFDKFYYSTYINYFNLYLYPSIKIYDVLLNFEKFKYEEDVILLGEEKAEK